MGLWGDNRAQWVALWGIGDNVGINGGLYGAVGTT